MIKSRLFWIVSAVFITSIFIILNFTDNKVSINPSYQASSMKDLHLKHSENNNVKWELLSEEATLPEGNKELLLSKLSLQIKQSPAIILTSGSGTYYVDEGNVNLTNSVELKMKDAIFTTDTIKWHSKDELINTSDAVRFVGNNFLITGNGLTAHAKQQKVRILNDVEATFYR